MSLSKSAIYDAGSRPDPKKPRQVFANGERRSEKWPSGSVERFVDLQGNVVQIQMHSPGVAKTADTIVRKRNQLHAAKNGDGTVQGFIEHGKCPLRHGLNLLTPLIEDEFTAMPSELMRPCQSDPQTARRTAKGIEYLEPCPHIKWLIENRIAKEADRRASRSNRQETLRDIELKKLAAAEATAAEARKTNDRIVELLASKPAQTKKAPTE